MRVNVYRVSIIILALTLLLVFMVSCSNSKYNLPNGGKEAMQKLAQNVPVASNDIEDWEITDGWISSLDDYGRMTLSSDTTSGRSAIWHKGVSLSGSWFASLYVKLEKTYADDGAAEILLGTEKGQALFRLRFMSSPAGFSSIRLVSAVAGQEVEILNSGWMPGYNSEYYVNICKSADDRAIEFEIYGNEGLRYNFEIEVDESQMKNVNRLGLGSHRAKLSAERIAFNLSYNIKGEYIQLARNAVNDLIHNYWDGGPLSGNIVPTWNGYTSDVLPDRRGGLWERGMIIFSMDSLYKVTGDPILRERIKAEWWRIKELYSIEELEAAGTNLHPAVDDCGWHANLYLICYEYTGDRYALDRAIGMVKNTYDFFLDDELGGGMWYNREFSYKSLYQLSVVLNALAINKYTDEKELLDTAIACYEWAEEALLRDDDIYWCEVNRDGPVGKERPLDIQLAGSVSFLGGNMAMSVAHARMYELTGEKKYLDRAIRTAVGITNVFQTDNGVFLNDRDAWANGTFMRYYATEVLTLPGMPDDCINIVFKTSKSIYENARTIDGYYGGCWEGPADGYGSKWSMIGSRPQQTMTSGSTVNMLIGAALLEGMDVKRSEK